MDMIAKELKWFKQQLVLHPQLHHAVTAQKMLTALKVI